jgi:hypothetical protein
MPGGRGVPQVFFPPQIIFFGELKPHAKFQNLGTNPSVRKVNGVIGRERENL